jgi:RNA polymerase sigma-70 factor (ECF subfamily)
VKRHVVADTTVSFDFDPFASTGDNTEAAISIEDTALIEALQQGAEEAYEYLIAHYQQPVYNLVYRLMEDPGDTNDIVQEVFLKIFRHVGSFRGQSSLRTWVYRIAVNEAHNHRRWFNRRRKREVGLENDDASNGRSYGDCLPDPGRSPFDLTLDSETMTLVEESLGRVKPVFREAVVLRDVEDLSYEEVAEVLQVSLGTVKSRILRGREALRKDLSARLERDQAFGWSPRLAEQD